MIEKGPVTGALAVLVVIVTVGAVVSTGVSSAVMENCVAAALGLPALSSAAPAAMSTVTVPDAVGVTVAL